MIGAIIGATTAGIIETITAIGASSWEKASLFAIFSE